MALLKNIDILSGAVGESDLVLLYTVFIFIIFYEFLLFIFILAMHKY